MVGHSRHRYPRYALLAVALLSGPAHAADTWRSASLRDQPITGPAGVVATAEAISVNARMGADKKVAEQVALGVYSLRGWGIAHSIAIDAPDGWIIIDTGDGNKPAAEMRAKLEKTVGHPIKVAAILLTHQHYTNGTAVWRDPGSALWGSEILDANRSAEFGLSPFSGVAQSRAIAQFGVLHPPTGPDRFPNVLGFSTDKIGGETSYQPPERLFPFGQVMRLKIAGEDIEVAPNRSDTTDSVGFWFPGRKLLVTNFMVTPVIFNIFTLRGGRFRDPTVMISDARWLEAKDADLLLDIHNAPIRGAATVKAAIARNTDQLQQIHDQTIRLIAAGLDAGQAAEAITMSPTLRDGAELYGQVESHVRAVWNNQRGWFGSDVDDINPLSRSEDARRTIAGMGGAGNVRKAAADATTAGGIDNWRWALRLTSLLLTLDPADGDARASRAVAARALGQRTTSANARGFYITEALQMENRLLFEGRPVTVDALRRILGTPSQGQITTASVPAVIEYLRYLVDPAKAGTLHFDFTLAVEGDPAIHRLLMRNGVLIATTVEQPAAVHVSASRLQLADFVLHGTPLPGGEPALAGFAAVFDRSQFVTPDAIATKVAAAPIER